jgi:hypothetical protein
MPPILQNGRTNENITTFMPPHTLKRKVLRHSCTRPPCHTYAIIDGLIPFLRVTTMPPIRQHGRTNQNNTTSLPPIRQNGWTNKSLPRDHHATHTPKLKDQSEHQYLHAPNAKMDGIMRFLRATTMPPIRQNGRTCTILARACLATHTPKWTDQ